MCICMKHMCNMLNYSHFDSVVCFFHIWLKCRAITERLGQNCICANATATMTQLKLSNIPVEIFYNKFASRS